MASRKHIKALSHNWTDSFCSGCNSVAGSPVLDALCERARGGEHVVIRWVPFSAAAHEHLPWVVRQGIETALVRLPAYLDCHDIPRDSVVELRTEFYRDPSHQIRIEAVAIDDRGTEYRQQI